jgi:hypothetical protein
LEARRERVILQLFFAVRCSLPLLPLGRDCKIHDEQPIHALTRASSPLLPIEHNTCSEMEVGLETVRVLVRVRPEFNEPLPQDDHTANKAITSNASSCIHVVDEKGLKIRKSAFASQDDKLFSYDRVFQGNSTREEVYQCVSDHVMQTINGYNTTIFAYGTTGSGKLYTMTGNSAAPGIIPRAIGDLFRHIETAVEKDRDSYFYVRLSFVELYNNNFRNLLENASRESSNSQTNDSKGLFSELDEMDGNAHQANPVRAHLIVGLNENRPKKPHHSSHDQVEFVYASSH